VPSPQLDVAVTYAPATRRALAIRDLGEDRVVRCTTRRRGRRDG
jgi:hypothetical protein